MTLTHTDFSGLAREYAAGPLPPRLDPGEHRTRLATGPDHEVWLLTWFPGQETELHDHGDSEGAFLVVSGVLNEQAVVAHSDGSRLWVGERDYCAGITRRFGVRHIHRIRNVGEGPAVSIHVYGPALTTMNRYDIDNGRLIVTAADVTEEAW